MTSEDALELPPATLFRCPPCLALPTADPHALAVECMLRFVGAHYVKRDAPLPVALEVAASSGSSKMVRYSGLASCLQSIENSTRLDAEALSHEQRTLSLCVKALVENELLPAFVYITHSDTPLFKNAIRKGVVPKVATAWQRLRGTYRCGVLEKSACCGRYSNLEEALERMESGLRALETLHVANAKAAGNFLLGTERPCGADALAYAAASSFLHADFVSNCASGAVVRAQRRVKEECPALLEYVERLRLLYFEEYSGFYTLRATGGPDATAADPKHAMDETFRQGRWAVLAWTAGFAAVYFVLTNAELILALLSEFDGEEMLEEEEEQH
ncbi:hypothetical protein DQ04_04991040 [Trypanosoma grayi]|uniref:hypothetical protein n=1 Tax=Trypanosoma grayi TaxID=71804 RepID=UPI0004F42CF7|nr:hypothetical protein DQ04_04991040 [Trypanosoma grayi]KEG09585.1 hypothetical protein DQ04_04991040 [Trypanosoma grayi]